MKSLFQNVRNGLRLFSKSPDQVGARLIALEARPMPSFRILGSRRSAIASALAVLASVSSPLEIQDEPNGQIPAGTEVSTPFKLQVKSNLVAVRVVVRDAQGNPAGEV